jgi:hypothetical protein
MTYNKKYIQRTKTQDDTLNKNSPVRNMYYGRVVSIDDPTDGGIIKVKIEKLDDFIADADLPEAYPILPKFFYVLPKIGEVVRVFIPDLQTPQAGRQYIGSVISQLHKIGNNSFYTALATTNVYKSTPDKAPSTFPDAKGVFPEKEDIAIIGRDNTDMILREREVEIRAGKHDVGDILQLNKTNPSSIKLTIDADGTVSSNVVMADKIALISHDGIPKFKAAEVDEEERIRIFEEAHPMVRGDVLLAILEIIRKAILQHVHPYDKMEADLSKIIVDLQNLDLENILQKNIVIN